MTAAKKPIALLIGVESEVKEFVKSTVKECQFQDIDAKGLEILIESPPAECPGIIICGNQLAGISFNETAQFLRSQFQEVPIYFSTVNPGEFDRSTLITNGYSDSFILNVDRTQFKRALELAYANSGNIRSYRSVRLLDIQSNSVLDFDVSIFLQANNKYITLVPSGEELGTERKERLEKHDFKSVHIPHDQMKSFYDYTAKTLKKVNSDTNLSETERREKVQQMVRSILTDVLADTGKEGTFDQGKAILADCQKVITNFIVQSTPNEWLKEVLSKLEENSDFYSHTGNVASLTALISVGVGEGKPEELALAGLLHDIGMAEVPLEIQDKPEDQRTEKELESYQKHVDATLRLIKQQKLILSENILKAISQHHEQYGGGGYPKGLSGDKVSVGAQILGFADQLDYLTHSRPGSPRIGVLAAVKEIQRLEERDPKRTRRFHPALFKKIVSLFLKD